MNLTSCAQCKINKRIGIREEKMEYTNALIWYHDIHVLITKGHCNTSCNFEFHYKSDEVKITHMWRRLGTSQNFHLSFIGGFWKTWKISVCTKSHNHIKYSSWDTELDKFFCHFKTFFAPLPNSPENQDLKKWIKDLEMSPF